MKSVFLAILIIYSAGSSAQYNQGDTCKYDSLVSVNISGLKEGDTVSIDQLINIGRLTAPNEYQIISYTMLFHLSGFDGDSQLFFKSDEFSAVAIKKLRSHAYVDWIGFEDIKLLKKKEPYLCIKVRPFYFIIK